MKMNKMGFWLAVASLLFWGCGDDVAGVTQDDNTVAIGSSSSEGAEPSDNPDPSGQLSSSSETGHVSDVFSSSVVSSSSAKTEKSSSSIVASSSSFWIPPGGSAGCKTIARQPKTVTSSVIWISDEDYVDANSQNFLDVVITERLKIVAPEKVENAEARNEVRDQLYALLGIDSLLADGNFVYDTEEFDRTVSQTLNYVFGKKGYALNGFVDKGQLDNHSYCKMFKGMGPWDLDNDVYQFMEGGGCALGSEFYYPLYTLQNMWRRCNNLPYCNESRDKLVQRAGNEEYGLEKVAYVCKASEYIAYRFNWYKADEFDAQTFDQVCDEDGKFVISTTDSKVAYVCRVGSGWDSTSTLQAEMGDKTCSTEGEIIQSSVDTNVYYACQNGKWIFAENGGEGDSEKICNENGKIYTLTSETSDRKIINRCYNGVWYPSNEWTLDVPVEYYFNPDFEYGRFTDPRDGYVYRTTEFDGKTWLSENLQYKGSVNDTLVANHSVCGGDSCKFLGRFYSAEAAQVACPEGWRLPEKSDLERMQKKERSYLDDEWFDMLASHDPSGYARVPEDRYGLSFIMAGELVYIGDYQEPPVYKWINSRARFVVGFWIQNKESMDDPEYFMVGKEYEKRSSKLISDRIKDFRLPVRCLKD